MSVEQNYRHLYTSGGITIVPDPPQAGVPTGITLNVTNTRTEPITVERIEVLIARFGIGMAWKHLPPLGPFTIPAQQSQQMRCVWTPASSGPYCVRVRIHSASATSLCVGRNVRAIEAATAGFWRTPFALGNPEDHPAAVQLVIEHDSRLLAMIVAKGRLLLSGETITLAAGEETGGVLLLSASTGEVLTSMTTVEAFIEGQFVDGIAVLATTPGPEADVPADHPPIATSHQQCSATDFPGNESGNWNLWRP